MLLRFFICSEYSNKTINLRSLVKLILNAFKRIEGREELKNVLIISSFLPERLGISYLSKPVDIFKPIHTGLELKYINISLIKLLSSKNDAQAMVLKLMPESRKNRSNQHYAAMNL